MLPSRVMPTSPAPSSNARLPDDALRRRRGRRGLVWAALLLTAAGCTSITPAVDRTELIRRILASTVQLRSEREGGARRAASGVVVATDPSSRRAWIVTVRHFLGPSRPQEVSVRRSGQTAELPAVVFAVSDEELGLDIAIVEVEDPGLTPVRLKQDVSNLGDEVLIVAFPWGQRLTVVRGIVSQIVSVPGESLVSGPARMVDAHVSYGSSGGGVFDARSGELIGIVETYRTAKISIPELKDRVIEVPVPGETVLVPAPVISRFLVDFGLGRRLPK
jgi:serine protease Do